MEPDQPAAPLPAAPHCYRHPGRETHVRCARCDRPICPDCMISAAVGFQCPECVREGNRSLPRARTTFGGRAGRPPGVVSYTLIAICAVVWIVQLASSTFTSRFALVAITLDADRDLGGVAAGEWWRLLTAAFMHASTPFHILLNMYALYLFGPPLESVFGRVRFLALYLLSALGGSLASYAFNSPFQPSLGASGAIFGLLGASIVVSRRLGMDAGALWVLLGLNLVLGFTIGGIDWHAHLGGLITGAAVAAILAYAPRQRQIAFQVAGLTVVLALIIGGMIGRTIALQEDPIVQQACVESRDASDHAVCDAVT
jgi:membrane associated rhomboid family serine protease